MIVEFDKSFAKSLKGINNGSLKRKMEQTILTLEKSLSISQVPHIKKMVGFSNYYRLRIGDYRIGMELINSQKVRLIIVAHRKEIYRYFP